MPTHHFSITPSCPVTYIGLCAPEASTKIPRSWVEPWLREPHQSWGRQNRSLAGSIQVQTTLPNLAPPAPVLPSVCSSPACPEQRRLRAFCEKRESGRVPLAFLCKESPSDTNGLICEGTRHTNRFHLLSASSVSDAAFYRHDPIML